MNIGVIGASGRIGQRIVAEALQRGHNVTAFTSNAAKIPADKGKVAWKTADVLNADSVGAAMQGQDVLISSYGPAMGADPEAARHRRGNFAEGGREESQGAGADGGRGGEPGSGSRAKL